jgi:hypothetical protein
MEIRSMPLIFDSSASLATHLVSDKRIAAYRGSNGDYFCDVGTLYYGNTLSVKVSNGGTTTQLTYGVDYYPVFFVPKIRSTKGDKIFAAFIIKGSNKVEDCHVSFQSAGGPEEVLGSNVAFKKNQSQLGRVYVLGAGDLPITVENISDQSRVYCSPTPIDIRSLTEEKRIDERYAQGDILDNGRFPQQVVSAIKDIVLSRDAQDDSDLLSAIRVNEETRQLASRLEEVAVVSATEGVRPLCAADYTTDDHLPIQNELNKATLFGYKNLQLDPCKRYKINSPLNFKAGESFLDLNGSILDFEETEENTFAVNITPTTTSAQWFRGGAPNLRPTIQNGRILGVRGDAATTQAKDAIRMGRSVAGLGVVANLVFQNLEIVGFRDQWVVEDGTYINFCYNVSTVRANRYGINYPGLVYAGENWSWFGGKIADCTNSEGTALGIYMPPNSNNQLQLYGTSIDYCDSAFLINSGRLRMFGGNLEGNKVDKPFGYVDTTLVDGNWAEVYLATDISPTEDAPGRPIWFNIRGDNVFFDISNSVLGAYRLNGEIVKVESGFRPKVRTAGSSILSTGGASKQPAPSYYTSQIYQGQDIATPTTSPWTAGSGNVVVSVATGAGVGGNNALQMAWSGTASSNAYVQLECKPGEVVQAEAMVKCTAAPASTSVYFRMRFLDSRGTLIHTRNINRENSQSSWSSTTTDFEKISAWEKAPQGTKNVQIDFWNGAQAATILVDNVHAWII